MRSSRPVRLVSAAARSLANLAALFFVAHWMVFGSNAAAHDIPNELRVHMQAKPQGEILHVLVRVPLSLLLNLNLPKHGPGYIDLDQMEAEMPRAIAAVDKAIVWREEGRRLQPAQERGRISVPSDTSFDSFEKARALLLGAPLARNTYVFWNQGYLDAYLQYPISSPAASLELDFQMAPGLRDRLKLDMRYIRSDDTVRAYEIPGGAEPMALNPHWYQAAWTFVKSGFSHILDGPDHLLFLLCLILPFRRLSSYLVAVVTAFTVAHSVTLISAAYGLTPSGPWFQPLVETLIALSVLYMAVENIFKQNVERRWIWSGFFGLIHGFGFSFLLSSQLQYVGNHLLLSLLAFNLGIELGQLLVLCLALPAITLFLRLELVTERTFMLVVSVLVAHTAWHWATERASEFWAADWAADEVLRVAAVSLPMLIAVLLIIVVIGARVYRRRRVAQEIPAQ